MGFRSWLTELLVTKSAVAPGVAAGGDLGAPNSPWGVWPRLLPSTRIDFLTEAGDLTENSIIQACVQWIGRTFPEAPLRTMKRGTSARPRATPIPDHPLTVLLEQPNEFYNGLLLWQATLLSYNVAGNAYWLKVRDGTGRVKEVWYEPDFTCRPVWPIDGTLFISGYQVKRAGQWKDVRREDVVHFRQGLDPRNTRLGLSPLGSALREVFTDNEAANFSASLLRNMGIPGVVLSPASPDTTIDDPEGLKRTMVSKFSGDRKGEPLVMQGPTKIDVLSFNPQQMNYEALRNIPEERIAALIGIPGVVVGLGSHLDHQTYNNYNAALEAAYHNNLLPTHRLLAAQLKTDLLADLGNPKTEFIEFDTSKVQALSEDRDALSKRLIGLYRGGVMRRDEARTAWDPDLPTDDSDHIYLSDIISVRTLAERVTVNEVATPGEDVGDVGDQTDPDAPKGGSVPALPPAAREKPADQEPKKSRDQNGHENGHDKDAARALLAGAGKEQG